jgi:probable HAF family extracellular repeat protein
LLESLEERCLLSYQLTNLGALSSQDDSFAEGINSSGQVAGSSVDYQDFSNAFLWDATHGIQALPPGGYSEAYGINDNGQVVGDENFSHLHAFLWDTVHGMQRDLGTLPGNNGSVAFGINNNGQVVGYSSLESVSAHAFLWDATSGMQDLGTLPGDRNSVAHGINASGQVIGESYIGSSPGHAFLWDATSGMQDLGTLPGARDSFAYGINGSGQVVGVSGPHAFLWDATNGMQDLGALPGDSGSIARSINDSGQVVGRSFHDLFRLTYHAFIWQNGTMSDLNDLIPAGSGLTLLSAEAINNAGQIVGWGVSGGTIRAFLLTPDSSPRTAPAGTVHFTSSDAPAVLLADSTVTAADAGVHPFSLTLATLGDQTLTGTATADATRIGRATVPGTSDAATPAGPMMQNATDALFARSHRDNASVSASDWEVKDLELGVSLLPEL